MKRGTPKHPKVMDLCDAAKIRRPLAIGYLELLWHFAAEFAPQGDVGRFSDKRIEGAMEWSGAAGKLIAALVESRWLDEDPEHRLIVHDWHDHADDAVRKKLARLGLPFLSLRGKLTGQRQTTAESVGHTPTTQEESGSTPEPEPVPDPKPEPVPEPESRALRVQTARDAVEYVRTAEYQRDATFCQWKCEYEQTGASFLENDWIEAYAFEWKPLDFEQKLAVVRGFRAQREAGMWQDPGRVRLPKNYLHGREFNRKPPTSRSGGMSPRTAQVEQNLRNLREMERRNG